MGGRGRGRGRGQALSINIETFGLGRGDILTPIQVQPPPLFPPLQFKPVPLLHNDDLEYRLALKQEVREVCQKSPFYIHPPNKVKDIERYSDKYQVGVGDTLPKLMPFWDRLPFELREKKRRKGPSKTVKPNLKTGRISMENVDNMIEKLGTEEAQDENEDDADEDDEDGKKKKEDEEGEGEEGEDYDEEDLEEENDYNMAYFDNGEGYGDDDDDDDEGPTY